MRRYKYQLVTVIGFTTMLLFGCASQPPLSVGQLTEYNAVSINKDVSVPSIAFYHGQVQSFAGVFGVLGALATMDDAKSNGIQLAEFMKKENINVGEIFIKDFEKQIIETKTFKVVQPNSEKAIFKTKIELFGLNQGNGLTSTLYPQLTVSAQLTKLDGTILWKGQQYITPINSENNIGDTLENFYKEPNKLRLSFEKTSHILAKFLIEEIIGSKTQ